MQHWLALLTRAENDAALLKAKRDRLLLENAALKEAKQSTAGSLEGPSGSSWPRVTMLAAGSVSLGTSLVESDDTPLSAMVLTAILVLAKTQHPLLGPTNHQSWKSSALLTPSMKLFSQWLSHISAMPNSPHATRMH